MIENDQGLPGLYIHIPFCRSKCGYCDFYSTTDTGYIDSFIECLLLEMDSYEFEFREFDTIYLGGGTPSLLASGQIEALLEKARNSFRIIPGAEITIEVNPADTDRDDLEKIYAMGINRINIGVQSFDEAELSFLGRRHDSRQAMNTLDSARLAGFDNIGLDLIYGLPYQTIDGWKRSLEKALAFGPEHLSCYELELKPDTPIGLRYEKGEFGRRTEEVQHDFFIKTSEHIRDAGYVHYEISNFASGMDRASRHNRKYWDHTPYLGLGPSAHSFKGACRWWNKGSVNDYILDLKKGRRPVADSEDLGENELASETLFLGLRMKKGIDIKAYRSSYGIDLMETMGLVIRGWEQKGLIEIRGGIIIPTPAGMAVADAMAAI